ncbi:hypothetical protein EMIT07CA2_170054 [Brevibacillus sp. IT-7CA2]
MLRLFVNTTSLISKGAFHDEKKSSDLDGSVIDAAFGRMWAKRDRNTTANHTSRTAIWFKH